MVVFPTLLLPISVVRIECFDVSDIELVKDFHCYLCQLVGMWVSFNNLCCDNMCYYNKVLLKVFVLSFLHCLAMADSLKVCLYQRALISSHFLALMPQTQLEGLRKPLYHISILLIKEHPATLTYFVF